MQLFLAFLVALSITALLIPVLARVAPSIGLTDAPGPRKLHSAPVPRVGGIAMALGILAPAVLLIERTDAVRGLLLGVLVLLVVGIWDDRVELNYRTKLLGQVVAVGLFLGVGGVHIDSLNLGARMAVPGLLSWGLTFVFLIGVTNAVNLSDGLDGLAGGMALLCFCALALLGAASGNSPVMLLALIEAGAILGFLRFNTHPARVFMGDSGSQVLGFTIGVLAILATQATQVTATRLSAALPLLLVGMPIIDTLAVMLHRMRQGRSPFTSDRNHLHHRLLELGFAHAEAVILLYLMQMTLFLLAYFLRFESDLVIIAVWCLFAAVLLATLRWADESGWKAHALRWTTPIRDVGSLRRYLAWAPDWALWVMAASMLAYVASVILRSVHVDGDVGTLCAALLLALLLPRVRRAEGSRSWLERAAAYIAAVLVVYLDQTAPAAQDAFLSHLSWTLLGITGAAALARLFLSPTRRFQVTSLDALVIFIALVVPNLPGSIELPPALSAGIAKAVMLLYGIEMLLVLDLKRALPRACLVTTLGLIAFRALVSAGV